MKKLTFIFLVALAGCSAQSPNYRASLEKYEGYSKVPYFDHNGYSVGIGHHIYGKVKRSYTNEEVELFYQRDLARNLKACRAGVDHFEELSPEVKQLCVGIAWGVGERGFLDFVKFRAALSKRDYQRAAMELKESKWYSQVSHFRSQNYINTLHEHIR